VVEYVEAARRLKRRGVAADFQLLGFLGVENRTAISPAELEAWVAEGAVTYLGQADDVRPLVAAADCVVLPSYREGTSRVLLEAAAMGKPLVATDVPGCREVVEDGVTGFLCAARSPESLTDAMARMAALNGEQRDAMGCAGRRKVEHEYDERIVIEAYRRALAGLGVTPLARPDAHPIPMPQGR